MPPRRKRGLDYSSMSVADIKKELAKAKVVLEGVEELQSSMVTNITTLIENVNDSLKNLVTGSYETLKGIDESLGTDYSLSVLGKDNINKYSTNSKTPYNAQGLIDLTALHKNSNESNLQQKVEEDEEPVEMKGYSNNTGTLPTVRGVDPMNNLYGESNSDTKALKPQPADSNNPINYASSPGSVNGATNSIGTNVEDDMFPSFEEFLQITNDIQE